MIMKNYFFLVIKVIVSAILIQTLWFKFTAHSESVYIFSMIGLEPFGRTAVGTMELVAAVLILIPGTSWMGALGTAIIMSGAIMFHLTVLGVSVQNDGGTLFALALITWVGSLVILWNERRKVPILNLRLP
jgi:uncharacterized membrane protein YphA (DoxX/SURF4 family)